MKRLIAALILTLGVTCAVFPLEAQQAGGAFIPSFAYTIDGGWTFTGANTFTGTQTFASGKLVAAAPVLSGSVTGTYTLAGTPTITSPTITGPVMTTISNTGTLTLPSATGGVPVALDCGATGSGNQTCAPVAATALTKVYAGTSTLSSNAAIITFPTAFNATTSYQCVANDITTRANPVQMLSTSTSTATITNTTGASDVVNWICVGQ